MKNILQNKKIIVFILMIFLVFAAILWYVNDIYHSNDSIKGYLKGKDFITVTEISDGLYLDGPGEDTAMIFIRVRRWKIQLTFHC